MSRFKQSLREAVEAAAAAGDLFVEALRSGEYRRGSSGVDILSIGLEVEADGEYSVVVQVDWDFSGGPCCVPVAELAAILADPLLWQAKRWRTTKERFLAYRDWKRSGGGCRGTTSEGKPCRWPHELVSDGEGPAEFVLGVSDRCRYHGGGDPYEKEADA